MKTSRLKTVVIAILVLLNLCLVVLLVNRKMQEASERRRTVDRLSELFAAKGVALDPAQVPKRGPLPAAADPARDLDSEAAFASLLLGPCETEDVGGGIYRYVGKSGQCLLRSSGAVEASPGLEVDDPEAFCAALFAQCGYELLSSDLSGGSGVVSAVRTLPGAVVFNARLTLTFVEHSLLSVSGFFLPSVAPAEQDDGIDAVTALVRFLDHSTASGELCTAVEKIGSGYLLQSTASVSQRLIPAWSIETDAGTYYVNVLSGEVLREA